MKTKSLFLIIFLIFFSILKAQNEFITIWQPGLGDQTNQISFYAQGVDYTIYWEEVGNSSHNGILTNVSSTNSLVTIDLGVSLPPQNNALYIVKISNGNGNFNRIRLNNNKQIINVDQWGSSIQWSSMAQAFYGCTNLIVTAPDVPNVANVTDFSGMFYNCSSLVGHTSFNNWNTSSAINLSYMFYNAKVFNMPIGNWNTANVTNMTSMFNDAKAFNQPIGNWNTANVTDMSSMFKGATAFNQSIENWNTFNVTNMTFMFSSAAAFNQPIGNWNTSNVTNMASMFSHSIFNQPIGNWNTSNVTNMSNMFFGAKFNQSIGNWDTANVTTMYAMFANTTAFNQPIGNWNTSNVTDMISMFSNAPAFNQPIGNWDTANVTSMISMFAMAKVFNQPIGNWNTSNVTNMMSMFTEAKAFNQPITNWNTSNVTNMSYMFDYTDAFNQPIGNWNTSNVKYMEYMFYYATAFNQPIGNWNLSNVLDLSQIFSYSNLSCINYDSILQGWANNPVTPNNITFGAFGRKYYSTLAINARNLLKNTKGWIITGDYYDPDCNATLSVNELNDIKEFIIYPNPVKNIIYFNKEISKVEILTMGGQILLENNPDGNYLELAELLKGIYILKAIDKKGIIIYKKFIKD